MAITPYDSDQVEEIFQKPVIDRLFFKNLPTELTEAGLDNMCRRFGEVTKMFRLDEKKAFVTFESEAAAQNANRQLRAEFEELQLPIIVQLARPRNENRVPVTPFAEEEENKLNSLKKNDDIFTKNTLRMIERKIQGPFSKPGDPSALKRSIITNGDYKNANLLKADPGKVFLLDWDDEFYDDFEVNNRLITHGRYISKSRLAKTKNEQFSFIGNPEVNVPLKKCAHCNGLADTRCGKCNISYCSIECIKIDVAHSKKCSNKPPVAANGHCTIAEQATEEMSALPLGKTVKLTCVLSHRLLFVRPASDEAENAFVRLMNDIVKCAKTANFLTSTPPAGTMCLAEFGGFYQRALVLKQSRYIVTVAFIDFGNIEQRPFNELKTIPEQLKQYKRCASKIALHQINEDIMNIEALHYLYSLMAFEKGLTIEIIANNESATAVASLFAFDDWINAKVDKLNKLDTVSDGNNETHIELNNCIEGKNIPVIIVDSSLLDLSEFSFILVDDTDNFLRIHRRVQSICSYKFVDKSEYTPRIGEFCVIRCNDRWYRAECIEARWDGFITVSLIDFGCVYISEICDVREMPQMLAFKSLTVSVTVLPKLDENDKEKIDVIKQRYQSWTQQIFAFLELREIPIDIYNYEKTQMLHGQLRDLD